MQEKITIEKLNKYFKITGLAIKKAGESDNKAVIDEKERVRNDFLDMIKRYYSDAKYFFERGDFVNAFAALNYAHGWLDAGARIKLFNVKDSRLFTVDDEE